MSFISFGQTSNQEIEAENSKVSTAKVHLDTSSEKLSFELIPSNNSEKLSDTYSLDISSLAFKSQKTLSYFCRLFSMSNYELKGDFEKQEILIALNNEKIEQSNLTLKDLNDHFENFSNRMFFIYNKSK